MVLDSGAVSIFAEILIDRRLKMFPTKNMMDYMTEMNRLFPRQMENEVRTPHSFNASFMPVSPFNPTMANQSSSSADSTSPESFPDMTAYQLRARYQSIPDCQPISDTPFPMRRQRPIIGRKIMTNPEPNFDMRPFEPHQVSPIKVIEKDADLRMFWQDAPIYPQTPPKPQPFEQKMAQNVYELFPVENKGFEFRTPDKNIPSPQTSRFSSANISPSSGISMSPISPLPQRYMTPPPPFRKNVLLPPSLRHEQSGRVCSFCKKNGETPLVYMTHTVKERVGNMNVVTCPILRSHVCATCKATGDNAHTITYCPVLRSNNNGLPLQSTTITLKNTRVKSNGRKRY